MKFLYAIPCCLILILTQSAFSMKLKDTYKIDNQKILTSTNLSFQQDKIKKHIEPILKKIYEEQDKDQKKLALQQEFIIGKEDYTLYDLMQKIYGENDAILTTFFNNYHEKTMKKNNDDELKEENNDALRITPEIIKDITTLKKIMNQIFNEKDQDKQIKDLNQKITFNVGDSAISIPLINALLFYAAANPNLSKEYYDLVDTILKNKNFIINIPWTEKIGIRPTDQPLYWTLDTNYNPFSTEKKVFTEQYRKDMQLLLDHGASWEDWKDEIKPKIQGYKDVSAALKNNKFGEILDKTIKINISVDPAALNNFAKALKNIAG